MSIGVTKLAWALGAEISGVDLAQLHRTQIKSVQ